MEIIKRNLYQILKENTIFEVPYYQRYYDWDNNHIEEILLDVLDLLNKEYLNKKNHFLGILVLKKFNDKHNLQKLEIIDGQQRLTSIFLILKAINIYYSWINKNYKNLLNENELFFTKKHSDKKIKLRLNNEDMDDTTLQKILSLEINNELINIEKFDKYEEKILKEITNLNKKSKIFKNFKFILFWLNKQAMRLIQLEKYNQLLLNLELIWLEINELNDNPQNIFESLNSKSKHLENIDLIKNYIFMNISFNDDQETLYNSYWVNMEKSVTKKMLNTFFKYILMIKDKKYIEEKNLGIFKKFKNIFKIKDKTEATKTLDELTTWNLIYMACNPKISMEKLKEKSMRTGNWNLEKYKNIINKHFYSAKISDYPIFISMILVNWIIDKKNNKIKDDKHLIQIIKIIDAYILRWATYTNQGNLSNPLLEIYKIMENSNKENIIKNIINTINNLSGQFKYVSDDEYIVALKKNPLSNSLQDIYIKIIEKMAFKKFNKKIIDELNNKEHIRPIKPNNDWTTIENHSTYISYLGNLILIDSNLNTNLSNSSFEDKRNKIIKIVNTNSEANITNSTFDFVEYLKNNNTNNWASNEIENRSEYLAKEYLIKYTKIKEKPII